MGTSSIFLCLLFLGGALGKGGLGNPWGLGAGWDGGSGGRGLWKSLRAGWGVVGRGEDAEKGQGEIC